MLDGKFVSHKEWVSNSETIYMYTKSEQIGKYATDSKSQVSHFQRSKL